MSFTEYGPNDYGFAQVERNVQQILHTNSTTRTLLFRELVVVKDANDKAFIGFVAEVDGIAASASGRVDLMEGDVVATQQREDAGVFVAGDTTVYILEQTNSDPADIKQASASGRFPLDALITQTENGAGGNIRLRMPPQDGTIIAVV